MSAKASHAAGLGHIVKHLRGLGIRSGNRACALGDIPGDRQLPPGSWQPLTRRLLQLTYKQLTAWHYRTGSFTGLRIGIATARGLSLGLWYSGSRRLTLAVPCRSGATSIPGETVLALIDAHRGEICTVSRWRWC